VSKILKISEAASLALHTTVLMAARPEERLSTHELAAPLGGVSEAHLAKVLQRLTKAGLVESTRGPGGGFTLARAGDGITLLEVFEAVEGPLDESTCLLGEPVCQGQCLLGNLIPELNRQVREYLADTRLSELVGVYGSVAT
jgi:Rrf2 family protein